MTIQHTKLPNCISWSPSFGSVKLNTDDSSKRNMDHFKLEMSLGNI